MHARSILVVTFVALLAIGSVTFFDRVAIAVSPQTQAEMNADAGAGYKKVDRELNDLYQAIRKDYAADTEFIAKLTVAQRAWIEFRDAELDAIFPAEDKSAYGSIYPMCRAIWLTKLTQQRIAELRRWSDGVADGEVCTGSVRGKTR